MPVKINCPNCSKELNAPDTLIGKLAACPRCNTQFPVTSQPQTVGNNAATSSRSVTPNYYPPGAGPPIDAAAKNSQTKSAASQQTPPPVPIMPAAVPSAQPNPPAMMPPLPTVPPTSQMPPETPPRTAQPILQRPPNGPPMPTAPFVARPLTAQPLVQPPAAPISGQTLSPPLPVGSPPVATQPAASTPVASPLRKPSERKVQAARFVSGGATTTRINLGADGKLPDLVVDDEEGKKSEKAEEPNGQGRPLLLAIALSVSVAMSLLMFFVESDEQVTSSKSKAKAREDLEKHYIGDGTNLKPYEKLLRDALVASRHGDVQGAKRRYRKVLDMLHAEDHGSPVGLVGRKANKSPPSDHDLKETLKILLSDR